MGVAPVGMVGVASVDVVGVVPVGMVGVVPVGVVVGCVDSMIVDGTEGPARVGVAFVMGVASVVGVAATDRVALALKSHMLRWPLPLQLANKQSRPRKAAAWRGSHRGSCRRPLCPGGETWNVDCLVVRSRTCREDRDEVEPQRMRVGWAGLTSSRREDLMGFSSDTFISSTLSSISGEGGSTLRYLS